VKEGVGAKEVVRARRRVRRRRVRRVFMDNGLGGGG